MTDLQFGQDGLDRRALLAALRAFRKGDFSVRLPLDLVGVDGEIAQAFNDVVETSGMCAGELVRIRDEVGREGRLGQRGSVPSAAGSWAGGLEALNALVADVVRPVSEIARVVES